MFSGIDHLGLFIMAGLLLNITPGPDVLYIVSSGVRGGWRGGVVAALGITAGCCVHIVAAAVGLGALVAASATAFTVLKWIGAAYLLYVGLGMLLTRRRPVAGDTAATGTGADTAAGSASVHLRKVFLQGFWTNALNPKVALFFLAFLPQFILPGAEHKTATFLLLGVIFNINALPINLGYGLAAAWMTSRMGVVRRGMAWLERLAGGLFIYFGVRLAISAPPAT